MTTTPERIGPYEINREIGRGGMGVVYLARDTKLDRDVAIKVLPDSMANDEERVLRFQREAKLLASLNHANIAQIHGFEEANEQRFLVLEYVEGETLSQRLRRGPLPVEDALDVGKQIAEALESAHENSVIHRDLKPGNVMVRSDGTVKVLDFGLARAMTDDSTNAIDANSPTITANFTKPGVVLGTASYMSPEQARGRPLDKRTDIWSFGVILYECLAGAMLFRGETATDSMGAIMHKDPEWSLLPPDTPPTVQLLLRRCLTKDRKRRLHDIADARVELDEALADPTSSSLGLASAAVATSASRGSRLRVAVAGGFVLGAVLAGLAIMALQWGRPTDNPPRVSRLMISVPADYSLAGLFALSPDGGSLVYVAEASDGIAHLFHRRLNRFDTTLLPGTEGAEFPFFSPDGRWVGFSADGQIRKIALAGGTPLTICRGTILGASWGRDDTVVFGQFASGLLRVPASGGIPTPITTLDAQQGEVSHGHPSILPDGDTVLFTLGTGGGSHVGVLSLASGQWRRLISDGADAQHLFGDIFAYARTGQLRIIRFDPGDLESRGAAAPVLEGIQWQNWGGLEHTRFSVADNGTLAYSAGQQMLAPTTLVVVDRTGKEQALDIPPGLYLHPSLSPDGRLAAVTRIEPGLGIGDIWIVDIERHTASRLSVEGTNYTPIWTPDGKTVTYVSNGNIVQKAADGSNDAETLLIGDDYERPLSWSADGKSLAYEVGGLGNTDIALLHEDGESEPLLDSPFNERSATISPDGAWVAYASDETGRQEVYVRSLAGPGARFMVSTEGGNEPRWSRDGDQLFYRNGGKMLVAAVQREPGFSVATTPKVLFDQEYQTQRIVWNYDVFPDGEHFILVKPEETPAQTPAKTQINIVLNWFEELRPLLSDE